MKKNEKEEKYEEPFGAFTRQIGLNILKVREFTDTELLAICNSIEGVELDEFNTANPDFISEVIQETFDLGEKKELEELIEKTENLEFVANVTLYYEVGLFMKNVQSWEEFKKKLTEQIYISPILYRS